jgi:threonine dehydrogenase-like Zn-dependent dehydrogenase
VGGFDATLVCVGTSTAIDDALRFTRSGGSIVLLGNVSHLPHVDWTPVWLKELSLHGSLCYHGGGHRGAGRDAFAAALELLTGPIGAALAPLVTHVVPLERATEAIAIAIGRAGRSAIKVAIACEASA